MKKPDNSIQDKKQIAQLVRESIAVLPAFEGMQIEVDEAGITASNVGEKIWWRVPIVPSPWPKRMSALYEALAEIEGHLQDERGLDILLYPGDASVVKSA
jgi:hypothetical protein